MDTQKVSAFVCLLSAPPPPISLHAPTCTLITSVLCFNTFSVSRFLIMSSKRACLQELGENKDSSFLQELSALQQTLKVKLIS